MSDWTLTIRDLVLRRPDQHVRDGRHHRNRLRLLISKDEHQDESHGCDATHGYLTEVVTSTITRRSRIETVSRIGQETLIH